MKKFATAVKQIHIIIPITVGNRAERTVHFILPVSFFIVCRVVEQGQCITVKIMTLTAVTQVQPFEINNCFISKRLFISTRVPCDRYIITAIGITISFAGKPRIKAIKITPSIPIICAKGSKKSAQYLKRLTSPIWRFARTQIIRPAGAATATALFKTNKVLSKIDLTTTSVTLGIRYGGSSSVNDDGIPFKRVLESSFVTAKVATIPKRIISVKSKAESKDEYMLDVTKNIVSTDIKIGNLPLHGTKLFVRIANSLSLGESIILQPTTPAALQPNPIHIVNDCLPQAQQCLNGLSRL